jgi:PAS domain S-box-containing protein
MTAQQPILIVEDDEVTAELERRVLTRAGRQTRTVQRAADAVEALQADTFGVVLLDYNLPDGDPWRVVEVAQARVPRVPVIVVTSSGSERIASEALHHGVAEYVQKTEAFWIQLPELVDRVARHAQVEESSRRSEALFRLIADSATDMFASIDLDGRVQEVSTACSTMLGWERDELIGRLVVDTLHPDDRSRVIEALRSKSQVRITYRQLRKDGGWFWAEANAKVIRDPATDHAREIVGIIRDVHERKRAEDRFRSLLEGAPEANVIVDRLGNIVLVNTRTEQLFGYDRQEIVGQPFEVLVAERFRRAGSLQLTEAAGPLEIGARRKDGSEFPSEISFNRLESEGEPLVSTTILDISDRKTLQDQHMLLQLGEKFARFDDVHLLVQHVTEELAHYFGVSRCLFNEIDHERGVSIVLGEYSRSGPSNLGEHPLDSFTPGVRRELEAGRIVSIADTSADLRTSEHYEPRYMERGMRAMAAVPLMRKGRWAGAFFVTADHIRRWTAREIQMLQALVERTWLWVEHVRMVRELRDSERKYRHFIESTHEGVWEIDAETRTRFVNPRMQQLFGYTAQEMLGRKIHEFMDEEGRRITLDQVERRKAGISESHDSKFIRKDGTPLWVRLETNPLVNEKGEFSGALAMVADIHERRQAEQDQNFLLALAETLTIANDPHVARQEVSKQLGLLLGVDRCNFADFDRAMRTATVRDGWDVELEHPPDAVLTMEEFGGVQGELYHGRIAVIHDTAADLRTREHDARGFATARVRAVISVPMHREGRLVAVLTLCAARPRAWTQREVTLAQAAAERTEMCVERLENLAALRDMSKELERRVDARTRELKAALTEKEVLLKEIHHRVKNNLQVISSMLNLQAMHISDPAAQAVFAESQGRVQSIALVHETLYESQDLSSVNFAEYIHTLVTTVMQAQLAPDRPISTVIDADGVLLPVSCAIPCGLIINELVTNSLKHAFPDRNSGTIRVGLHTREKDQVELVVADDGIGLAPNLDPRRVSSLGLDLVFTFAEQLSAEVALSRDNGTEFRFLFDITQD